MSLLSRYVTLCFLLSADALFNKGNNKAICIPAEHYKEGETYCSGYSDGWGSGGTSWLGNECYHPTYKLCECSDCGGSGTECTQIRCDDDVGEWNAQTGSCVQTTQQATPNRDPIKYTNCYTQIAKCDINNCEWGYYLSGCMRKSSGSCVRCPPQPDNHFQNVSLLGQCWQPCPRCPVGKYSWPKCTERTPGGCTDCPVLTWMYLPPGAVDCLHEENWLHCNPCTPESDYNNSMLSDCPHFDPHMGHSEDGHSCLTCTTCPDGKFYQHKAGIKCVTSTDSQCKVVDPGFQWKFQRVMGTHNPNEDYNDGDILPHHDLCAHEPPAGFEESPKKDWPWSADCDYTRSGQCKQGYYRVEDPSTRQLHNCVQCPNDDHGRTPGTSTRCLCADGTALWEDLVNANGSALSYVLDNYCYDCSKQAVMPGNQGTLAQEAVVCVQDGKISRCKANEIVSGNACTACLAGSQPDSTKRRCIKCERGRYFDSGIQACVACKGETEYCDQEGMLAPLPKRMQCNATKMLVMNSEPWSDNSCEDCPDSCPEGNRLVYAAGRNHLNGCSLTASDGSSQSFFACYPPDGSNSLPPLKFYALSFAPAKQTVVVEPCEDHNLPAHAEWVEPGTAYPLGCVFACTYGWKNRAQVDRLHAAIQAVVMSTRADLMEFWQQVMTMAKPTADTKATTFAYQKALWPSKNQLDQYAMIGPNEPRWEQKVTINPTAWDQQASYLQTNTFLYLKEVASDLWDDLCYAPEEEVVSTPCPLGFSVPSGEEQVVRTPCAILARTYGIFSVTFQEDSASYYAVVSPDGHIHCHVSTDAVWLHHWSSYERCVACLDQNSVLMSELELKWRRVNAWATVLYGFKSPGLCTDMTCASAHSVRIGQACVPCTASTPEVAADWVKLCPIGSALDDAKCTGGLGPFSSVESVCVACDTTSDSIVSTLPAASIAQWISARGSSEWANIACKYVCAANFTSNSDLDGYSTRPCVACKEEVVDVFVAHGRCDEDTGGAYYFDAAEQTALCNSMGSGIMAFTPRCVPCTPIQNGVLIAAHQPMATKLGTCLGQCDPSLYFTIAQNSSRMFEVLEQGLIARCEPCGEEHLANCSNLTLCVRDYFWNGSACQDCNQTACDSTIGLYRSQCAQGSYLDSRCAECGRSMLFNDEGTRSFIRSSGNDLLIKAFNASQLSVSRRWAPTTNMSAGVIMRSDNGCMVVCVNNYVWIDVQTGRQAQGPRLSPSYACLPCASEYMQGQATDHSAIYSVWNFRRGSGRLGGCYSCPPNTNTIAESDVMCESIIGYGTPVGTPVNVSVMVDSSQKFSVTVPSVRGPAFRPSTQTYYICCGANIPCRIFNSSQLDKTQVPLGEGSAYATCVKQNSVMRNTSALSSSSSSSSPQRRLLVSDSVQACYTGQYNHKRGDNACYSCPAGSSTPYPFVGIPSAKQCLCLPGYYRAAGSVDCKPCGWNRHRSAYMNETACEPCPVGMMTPSDTSANCYCKPGLFANASGVCDICKPGSYCEGGFVSVQCPLHSSSPPGSQSRGDCVCNAGSYYGSLALPGSVCMRLPFAQHCEGNCTCAKGWMPVYNVSADGQSMRMHCIMDCALGSYARVNPSTFEKIDCIRCPRNTYSSSHQAVEVVGAFTQCTPCPLNLETLGVGSRSLLDCQCTRGVMNASALSCGLCAAGTYLDPLKNACRACPPGSTSSGGGAVGVLSCVCPSGARLSSAGQCEPCPRNSYSSSTGLTCTPCPPSMITLGTGSQSLSDCRCPSGYHAHAGRCVIAVG